MLGGGKIFLRPFFLTEIWLDGGCGAMCDKVGALVKQTNAAKAVAFNGGGVSDSPVRWCGTEGGNPKAGPGRAVWSTAACGWCPAGSGSGAPPNTSNAIWYQPQGQGGRALSGTARSRRILSGMSRRSERRGGAGG
eukprot:SAG25_NODE_361_length_9156_cov_9.406647_7_plen_136_part_00